MASHFPDAKWACPRHVECGYKTHRKDLLRNHLNHRPQSCGLKAKRQLDGKDWALEEYLQGSREPWLTEEGIERVLRPEDDDRSPTAIKIRRLKDWKEARS